MPAQTLDGHTRRLLAATTGAPDFILPWIDRFYSAADADLVLAVAAQRPILTPSDPTTPLARTPAGATDPLAVTSDDLERALRRALLDRRADGSIAPSSFHARFEMWAFFEGWCDLPSDVRRQLNEWELADYLRKIGPGVEAIRDGRPSESDQGDYTFLLLGEAEEILRAEPHIYLWPCNCRAMWGNCDKPLNVCLRFSNDRNIGWELSPDRAIDVLREADRAGLMHAGYLDNPHGEHGICNCCTDCCFPLVAAQRLEAETAWPRRRHLASIDTVSCTTCGLCLKRCPYGAITRLTDTDGIRSMIVDAAACRGCGICSTTCKDNAITMLPLA